MMARKQSCSLHLLVSQPRILVRDSQQILRVFSDDASSISRLSNVTKNESYLGHVRDVGRFIKYYAVLFSEN